MYSKCISYTVVIIGTNYIYIMCVLCSAAADGKVIHVLKGCVTGDQKCGRGAGNHVRIE